MTATMVVATPGGAATPEKEYSAKFPAKCVIAPGSLNQKGTLEIETHSTGPEAVTEGQSFTVTNASSTIATSPELGNTLFKLGARTARGKVTTFEVVTTNLEPKEINIAAPPSPLPLSEGLPYETAVEENRGATFKVPKEGTYSFGPFKVTGKAGESAVFAVSPEPGFKEIGAGEFEATGKGIVSTLEGVNEKGEHVIGPLTVTCTASAELARIPIVAGPTSSTSTTSTSSTTSTTTTTTSATTAHTTSSSGTEVTFQNWKLTGSLTDKKLGQTITLPAGCTFNGQATVPGPVEGNTKCPPFTASVKILSLIPTTLGLELTESEPIKGTITSAGGGNLTFKATAKDNIVITSVALMGLKIPSTCTTKEPVVFPLETTAPSSALATGTTFKGETTLPAVKCGGGFLGIVFGGVLTQLMSGPNNPFTLTIEP
jgi:hypothetical protein